MIHDHAVGVESPAKSANRSLHALDPSSGQAVLIALVVERNDCLAQDSVEIFSVTLIVNVHSRVGSAGADCEAIQAVERFRPPSVQNRKVQASVQNNLLAACSRGFERT